MILFALLSICLSHSCHEKVSSTIFFFFWLCCVSLAVHEPSLVSVSGGHSLLQCTGFSLLWPLLFRSTASRLQWLWLVDSGALSQYSPQGIWDLLRAGIEPVFPAVAGRLPTIGPPGKPSYNYFKFCFFWQRCMACRILVP